MKNDDLMIRFVGILQEKYPAIIFRFEYQEDDDWYKIWHTYEDVNEDDDFRDTVGCLIKDILLPEGMMKVYFDIDETIQKKCEKNSKKETQMSDLKPCPFCGKDPNKTTSELSDRPCFYYECENPKCGAAEMGWHNTEQEAIDAWNNRPVEDALQARIEELEKAAVVWHKYPEEKPPNDGRYLFWDSDGNAPHVLPYNDIVVRDNPGVFSTQTHWASLPAPPKEG